MKAIIIDDEAGSRNAIQKLLNLYFPNIEILIECDSIEDGVKLIGEHDSFDILFLDVKLRDGNAFDLLDKLPCLNFEIVFITGHKNYAINAIKYSAVDYLLKPLIPEEFQAAINKAIQKRAMANNLDSTKNRTIQSSFMRERIAISDSKGLRIIDLDKVIYCIAEGNYTQFVLTTKEKILICKNLKEFELRLQPHDFLRIHNRYLINMKHITTYFRGRGGQVEMSNHDILDVARNRKQDLLDALSPISSRGIST